ncbi:MAG: glycosyltransferase domain-containing protein [Litoreibacter sp.]
MRVTFYTVNIARYDYVFPVPITAVPPAGMTADWIFFSDRRPMWLQGWKWQGLPQDIPGQTATETNRYCKFFPQRLFPEADISVYLDANVVMTRNIFDLVQEFATSKAAIGLGYVEKRETIQAEGEYIEVTRRFDAATRAAVHKQIAHYETLGLPSDHRLMQGRVIMRNHAHPDLDAAMQTWWDEFMSQSRRDQISLPYVLHHHNLPVHRWDWSAENGEPLFYVARHRPSFAAFRPEAYLEAMQHSGPFWQGLYRGMQPIFSLRAAVRPFVYRTRRWLRARAANNKKG